ncbi:MAG: hypothetical protein ACI8S6_002392 [Myxococcota bacterium]
MTTPPPAAPAPVQIPPSIGGTGLAVAGGGSLGWNLAAMLAGGEEIVPGALLPGLALVAFVVVLLSIMQAARKRAGIIATPASLRRQWLIVGAGLLIGLIGGVGMAFSG